MRLHQTTAQPTTRFARDTRRAVMVSRHAIFRSDDGCFFGTQGEAETHEIRAALRPARGIIFGCALSLPLWAGLFWLAGGVLWLL